MSDTQNPAQDTNDAGNATQGQQTADQTAAPQGEAKTDATQTQQTEEVSYEFTAPDGVELDEASLGEFQSIAKELKLPKDGAQKLFDLAAKREVARAEAFAKQVQDWGDTVAKDPELGKAENLSVAKGVIQKFGSPELVDLLNSTGMGNHPEVVKLAYKIGKAMSEDKIVRGNEAAPVENDPAKRMFPNMN